MKRSVGLIFLLLVVSSLPSGAQLIRWGEEKAVQLVIPRPPAFGLTVKRIAFGQPGGQCATEAAELVDRMIMPDFQENHIDVIERQALDQIMAEHNLKQSGYASQDNATELGKILGPSALVIVTVTGCSREQIPLYNDQKNYNGTITRTFISKTRFALEGSIRVVNLTTGQVMGSHNFESKPEKVNTSQGGQPEYPAVDDVKDQAMQGVRTEIHGMFFPGIETARLAFYDDKDCGLKQAYEVFQRGDPAGALKLAESNLEQCKSSRKKERTLARAYYDAGLIYCLQSNYDKANQLFAEAMQSKGAEAVTSTSADCNRAREGAARVQAYQDRVAQIPMPSPISTATDKGSLGTKGKPPVEAIQNVNRGVAPDTRGKSSVEERLKKLDAFYKKGLISKKDYEEKKAEILKDL